MDRFPPRDTRPRRNSNTASDQNDNARHHSPRTNRDRSPLHREHNSRSEASDSTLSWRRRDLPAKVDDTKSISNVNPNTDTQVTKKDLGKVPDLPIPESSQMSRVDKLVSKFHDSCTIKDAKQPNQPDTPSTEEAINKEAKSGTDIPFSLPITRDSLRKIMATDGSYSTSTHSVNLSSGRKDSISYVLSGSNAPILPHNVVADILEDNASSKQPATTASSGHIYNSNDSTSNVPGSVNLSDSVHSSTLLSQQRTETTPSSDSTSAFGSAPNGSKNHSYTQLLAATATQHQGSFNRSSVQYCHCHHQHHYTPRDIHKITFYSTADFNLHSTWWWLTPL